MPRFSNIYQTETNISCIIVVRYDDYGIEKNLSIFVYSNNNVFYVGYFNAIVTNSNDILRPNTFYKGFRNKMGTYEYRPNKLNLMLPIENIGQRFFSVRFHYKYTIHLYNVV